MAGISAVGGLSTAQFQAEYTTRVLKLGKDAISEQGKRALELIQAASIDPNSGQNLNITV
jgi:hypothetical protein